MANILHLPNCNLLLILHFPKTLPFPFLICPALLWCFRSEYFIKKKKLSISNNIPGQFLFIICQATFRFPESQYCYLHQIFHSSHLSWLILFSLAEPNFQLILCCLFNMKVFTLTFPWSSLAFVSHCIFQCQGHIIKVIDFNLTCRFQTSFRCSSSQARVTSPKYLLSIVLSNHPKINLNQSS